MSFVEGIKKFLFLFFLIVILLFTFPNSKAMASGPWIVDVTTKQFSVVWTENAAYTSCGIQLYTNAGGATVLAIDSSQIIVETPDGSLARANRIAKVTVIGLNPNTSYYCKRKLNGAVFGSMMTVQTENLRGLFFTDSNVTDIVSNDVAHKAVYKSDGTSPAQGVLVCAEIFDPDGVTVVSDYPISAWVGEGMLGSDTSTIYDSNNISYKQYAALNMNNLFGKDHFPLSLQGDNPATTSVNEGEIIKFIIIHGILPVSGQVTGQDNFVSMGRIISIDKINNEKITTAKVSASFKFPQGLSAFAMPFNISSGYTTGDLMKAIDQTYTGTGTCGIVDSIYVFNDGIWKKTFKNRSCVIQTPLPLPAGQGCFIVLKEPMTKEVVFYGKPENALFTLANNKINMISIPQLSAYYTTKHFLNDIEISGKSGNNTVDAIYSFVNGVWTKTFKNPRTGVITGESSMKNTSFYAVSFKQGANNVVNWDPFANI